ncbi:MAG: L-aspartate oxidase [Thermodesulfovibrionales bacterium]|nr:L-aspartate oxidase [Thermodesulfovibrionales bacterium]
MEIEVTDFLVIGSGVAGLRAAIELAKAGEVTVVTKDIPTETSTEYAQGGIAVALSDEDEVGIHYEDTLRAGDGLCNEEAVRILVEEGPLRIMELIEWGAQFDREGSKLAFTQEAAHSKRRVLHARGDSTGKELERVLLNKVKTFGNVRQYSHTFTVDLIVEDGECRGAFILKMKEKKITAILAKAVVLATGGAGQVYERTTNPLVATGDGMAMALRAGVTLRDMEFVQFHPTALYLKGAPNFLLTEAMRGEGAVLRNTDGEQFMKRYTPMAELAPRDIVSRAIISEMVRTGSSHVYLDLRHMSPDFVRKRFPTIYNTCLGFGIDITKDLIPVSPAAHYIMGGVKTDLDGRTDIKGLYAAGEVACTGVHGANRLASNSLLEGLVYGARTGIAAKEREKTVVKTEVKKNFRFNKIEHERLKNIRSELKRLMWEKVGVIRCGKSLDEAINKLKEWNYITQWDYLTREEGELKNMLSVAELITLSALERKGSVGAHYRTDFKDRGINWQMHVEIVKRDKIEVRFKE